MSAASWHGLNQRYLTAALDSLAGRVRGGDPGEHRLEEIRAAMAAPPALDSLAALFSLSDFERDLVLLCAGVELESGFAETCLGASGESHPVFPTFSFALAKLAGAHWSALSPAGPLRHWRLIDVSPAAGITAEPLRLDERILHYLTGIQYLDERLAGLIEPVGREDGVLVESHRRLVEQAATVWASEGPDAGLSAIQLNGSDGLGRRQVAGAICAALNLDLASISAATVPVAAADLDGLARLWGREAVLTRSALLIECEEIDDGDGPRQSAIGRLIDGLSTPVLVSARTGRRGRRRPLVSFVVERPGSSEQRRLWLEALGDQAARLNGHVERLVGQFRLNASEVRAAAHDARARGVAGVGADELGSRLWDACRTHTRPRLEQLAQRIEPVATWDDLVLPEAQLRGLRELAIHARRRLHVYEEWGFATKSARGLGISALFAGVSGTGKTMAAEVLANELQLDLYRIDLAGVVSKYIGETEKNLRRVFDAAESGGAILLFDEADALFGKRSEVKDSHDRYANIEVSYLLQRMEAYQGLAILTSNMKSALDTAFLRRLRFVVEFPFPDLAARVEIWRRIFPSSTPTAALDVDRLAQLNVAGGNIRNIALNGAFLASDRDEAVGMNHLLEAARAECKKLERPLSEVEIRGWER